jgi:hypothetical protein
MQKIFDRYSDKKAGVENVKMDKNRKKYSTTIAEKSDCRNNNQPEGWLHVLMRTSKNLRYLCSRVN